MNRVILLNGAPGSGKDTIAELLRMWHGFEQCEFKAPLFAIAGAASGICPLLWEQRYEDREMKEKPWDLLGGLSQREFMIKISEDWVKPVFGEEHFGILAARAAQQSMEEGNDVVFSDSGFPEEMEPLIDLFGVDDVLLVRLNREGYSFDNDSRDYITPVVGQHFLEISIREGDPDRAVLEILQWIERVQWGKQ